MELVEGRVESSSSLSSDQIRDIKPADLLSDVGARILEQSLTRSHRRRDGVFFSGMNLAAYVASRVEREIASGASIADPTCGGGDLLLACLRHAKKNDSVSETAKSWGERVSGFDLEPRFVEAARHRIATLAASVHDGNGVAEIEIEEISKGLLNLVLGDYLENARRLAEVDVIVTNPPFGTMLAPIDCGWSTGQTQRAAIFIDKMVESAKAGQKIVAILPDVLRSGSRYLKWRLRIEKDCQVLDVHPYGRFGDSADIDVFVLHITKIGNLAPSSENGDWAGQSLSSKAPKLSDTFNISIGSVVPHRHGQAGPWCPYLDVSVSAPGKEVVSLKKRRFKGKLVSPPFIVIRRTSSPSDRRRIVPTLVNLTEPVAVENHLVVLSPMDCKLSTCQRMMEILDSDYVDRWVNSTNRCRHLTKGLVQNIPIRVPE
ncbi:N-6 DNA methylase [Xanthomonas campestris pv. campestris]|uniref:N-6 DNA methylase n=1 Tax=Xanthomonas campestris TaxID=339 RepID=UPI002AD1D60D|nr:N-6 DNA methylase [Xanthomonas campestris]MEA0736876.1 N-6 DNA methylase [Xanthomonas campestris pv. campestris]